ncbi:hypothetical protein LX64_02362 [Chitinophaga skermanii]|uniref:Uncharacterized protein n=1 Tax=Chitinophaga skermanii TaxID=331697 RepID=A0A327QME5_9BACT|nr:hypothetical protein [Chitinophaga skermanii]RAJ05208.1 hypothetical protein LX64_02362 [Chitinophaga skermanii]
MQRPLTSHEYLHTFEFEYIETYSFNRGDSFIQASLEEWNEYQRLSRRVANGKVLTADEKQRMEAIFSIMNAGIAHLQHINNHLPAHVELISKLHHSEASALAIISHLSIPALNIPYWMCAPVYRDAIVFYSASGQVVSILNVCFSCDHMLGTNNTFIGADMSCYPLLRQEFLALGHKIEERN